MGVRVGLSCVFKIEDEVGECWLGCLASIPQTVNSQGQSCRRASQEVGHGHTTGCRDEDRCGSVAAPHLSLVSLWRDFGSEPEPPPL